MKDRELKEYLQNMLHQEVSPARLEETVAQCTGIMRGQIGCRKEERAGFWEFLSDVFRFEGITIFGLQAGTLFFICMLVGAIDDVLQYIPVFMPLFALAVVPALLRSQFYNMSEMEAVTRASGAEIILAKLILLGAANLVCITVLLSLEMYLHNSSESIGQMILYCLVPYLVSLTTILRLVRLRKKESISVCAAVGSCAIWGISVKAMPGLYETSAFGLWILLFVTFAVFFGKEIYFILKMRKEGGQYGIIF